jgi:WD40 repeat protein
MSDPHVTLFLRVRKLSGGHRGMINSMSFSRDGDYLATASEDGSLAVWETEAGLLKYSLCLGNPILTVAWDPRKKNRLFLGLLNGTAGFVDDFEVPPTCPFNSAKLLTLTKGPIRPILMGVSKMPIYSLAVDPLTAFVALAAGPEIHIASLLKHDCGLYYTCQPDNYWCKTERRCQMFMQPSSFYHGRRIYQKTRRRIIN